MLPEDQLQIKWTESEGVGLGYLVQVKPMAGMALHLPTRCEEGRRLCTAVTAQVCISASTWLCDSALLGGAGHVVGESYVSHVTPCPAHAEGAQPLAFEETVDPCSARALSGSCMLVAGRASRGRREAEGSWRPAQAGHRALQTWPTESPWTRGGQ